MTQTTPRTPSRPRSWSWPARPARWQGRFRGQLAPWRRPPDRHACQGRGGPARVHERRGAAFTASRTAADPAPAESWPALHEEIDRLPDRYRDPIVLCYLEGLSTEEAALRIGCPRGTVLSRLSRRGPAPRPADPQGPGPRPGAVRGGLGADRPGGNAHAPVQRDGRRRAGLRGAASHRGRPDLRRAAALARGLLHVMTISRLTILGAAALSCPWRWAA